MTYTDDELRERAHVAVALGGRARLTGAWVWVEFDSRPCKETRDHLKAAGYRWASKKQMWYIAGKPAANKRGMPWHYITEKYGEEDVTA